MIWMSQLMTQVILTSNIYVKRVCVAYAKSSTKPVQILLQAYRKEMAVASFISI